MTDATNGTRPDGPLKGVRVLDVTHMLSGPYCTWLLGALGADVIKIEKPGTGDMTRVVAPFTDDKRSLYYLSVNRNKRSVTLDLKDERGKAIFRKLAANSDVLVENNRAGVMEKLQLGPKDMAAINPRLIYASISGFGQTGPYSHRPSFDVVAQALSGMMSITGEIGGEPCRVGASIGDIGSSLFATVGILSALQQRNMTGAGTTIDVAMLDCQIALMENAVARTLNANETPQALGSRHPLIAPFQAFPTKDRPIALCVNTNKQWAQMCKAMGLEQLLDDRRFDTGPSRNQHHAELEPILIDALRQRPRSEWLKLFEDAEVPVSPINSVPEALEDPQIVAREMVVEVPPGSGERFAAVPIHVGGHAIHDRDGAPTLGQHSREILAELGLGADAIAELARDNVI